MTFWRIARVREVGINRLADLGIFDPVNFDGWDDISELGREIAILQMHLAEIDFIPEIKSQWLAHLVYCHSLLVQTAPKTSIPWLSIG
jgi:hypothetical protein